VFHTYLIGNKFINSQADMGYKRNIKTL